jgi:hypothetical protein
VYIGPWLGKIKCTSPHFMVQQSKFQANIVAI